MVYFSTRQSSEQLDLLFGLLHFDRRADCAAATSSAFPCVRLRGESRRDAEAVAVSVEVERESIRAGVDRDADHVTVREAGTAPHARRQRVVYILRVAPRRRPVPPVHPQVAVLK